MAEIQIAVTKGKDFVTIDTDKLPQEVYEAALAEGLKSFVNKGMAKILTKDLEGDDLAKAQAAAMSKANENVAAMLDGSIKLPGKKAAKKASGAVMTEARRLARNLIKDEIKRTGGKISHYEASEITKAANALLDTDQGKEIMAQAEENLKERDKVNVGSAINLSALIKESPKKVAAAEKAKKDKKSQLSATQAGKTKARPAPSLSA